ncbi:MAG TPA: hypothetical protein VM286_09385 [Candidatus Thermoplasmatota archaeon]|nr:hypothetical protein [Candidatus Thermoplasmatota archaeon]
MDEAAARFVEGLASQDFHAVRAALDPNVRFRFATPSKVGDLTGNEAVADQLAVWFGQGEVQHLGHGLAPASPGSVRAWYRFRVRPQPVTKAPGWHVIEQQAYLASGGAPIRNLRMVCTGFVPEETASRPDVAPTPPAHL